ncbi:MFS transporter [Pseudomonas sp. S31]|uniref:MFS transporter n=1 Tax=Pseudomonas sp. S31 TaxID=1564473 RepID=UPI001F227116|nr:MFS transporter [Pseudomonas sp. S31]
MSRYHILLLLLMSLLGVFPLDVILPSLPALASEYQVEVWQISYSVSTFALGVALAQILIGPLSDRMGRKRLLLAGLAVAVSGSVGCLVAPNFPVFMAMRIIQALGCGCFVLSHALVEDNCPGRERIALRILLSSASGLFISLSPLAGSYLQEYLGWRGGFVVFIMIGVLVAFIVMVVVEERPTAPAGRGLFHSYGVLAKNLPFLGYSTINALGFTCHFSFIVISPLLLMERLGLSSLAYSWVFVGYGCSFFIGGWIARQINRRLDPKLQVSMGLRLIGGAGLLLAVWHAVQGLSVSGVLIPMILCTTGTTILRPAAMTSALSGHSERGGAATALSTTMMLAIGGTLSSLVASFEMALPLSLVLILLGTNVVGCLMLRRMGAAPREHQGG